MIETAERAASEIRPTHEPIPTTLLHRAEYAALRASVAAASRVGFFRAGRFGERLGRLAYRPFGIRRGVVERQLQAALPALSPDEIRRIALSAYGHLGRTSVETAVLASFGRQAVLDLFEAVHGWEFVEQGLAARGGLILITGHLGNWELGGAYLAARGVPVDVVARHMANPLFDGYLTRTRERIGMTVLHDDVAGRRVPRSLRAGRAVAFLADQGAIGLASVWVPFFGRLAKTPRGPAVFALRLHAPMVFGVALRQPSGRFHLHFEPIAVAPTGDRDADIDRIVTEYTATLERWVRRAPDQYLWHHRRWKHQRPGTPPGLGNPLED